jgi:3-isopropylmalate/(R)-2-methylmalate dehydratase small subunit
MHPIKTFKGKAIALPVKDIDTDQIIPARFLKTIDKLGLGKNLFNDWRYLEDGSPNPHFLLNQPRAEGAAILVAGDNFGCGSSREHAPWALMGFGFQAVISTSFADIFQGNCYKNGLLPIMVDEKIHADLLEAAGGDNPIELEIDLPNQLVRLPDGRTASFPIDDFSKKCLMDGVDQLGYLQQQAAAVSAYESAHMERVSTG